MTTTIYNNHPTTAISEIHQKNPVSVARVHTLAVFAKVHIRAFQINLFKHTTHTRSGFYVGALFHMLNIHHVCVCPTYISSAYCFIPHLNKLAMHAGEQSRDSYTHILGAGARACIARMCSTRRVCANAARVMLVVWWRSGASLRRNFIGVRSRLRGQHSRRVAPRAHRREFTVAAPLSLSLNRGSPTSQSRARAFRPYRFSPRRVWYYVDRHSTIKVCFLWSS